MALPNYLGNPEPIRYDNWQVTPELLKPKVPAPLPTAPVQPKTPTDYAKAFDAASKLIDKVAAVKTGTGVYQPRPTAVVAQPKPALPAPSNPNPIKPPKEDDNAGMWIAGGIVAVALIGSLFYASSKKGLSGPPKKKAAQTTYKQNLNL